MKDNETTLSRRGFLLRAGATGLSLTAVGGLVDATRATATGTNAAQKEANFYASFKPSAGTDIPKTTVRLAMSPYGDQIIDWVGMRKGYFKHLGINVTPPSGAVILDQQIVPRFVNHQVDVASYAMSLEVLSVAKVPDLKMICHVSTYVGNQMLISPKSGVKTLPELIKEGKSFTTAMRDIVQPMKGKLVTLSDSGANHDFFRLVLKMGGLTTKDIDLRIMADTAQVQLARNGGADFMFPNGAAQIASILELGYKSAVGAGVLLKYLPPGDPRAVGSISDSGLGALEPWVKDNLETVLRYNSVLFRTIDEILTSPDEPLSILLPFLNSAASLNLDLKQMKSLYTTGLFYDLIPFDKQVKWWVDVNSPYYVPTVYKNQIAAGQQSGAIPKTDHVTAIPDLTIAGYLWKILYRLKNQYDDMKGKAGNLSGHAAELADQAATFYAHRNYLDAYRFLKAGTQA